MNCLVCREVKEMNTFREVLFLSNSYLCERCESQLILNMTTVRYEHGVYITLFEDNEFLSQVMQRISKGDLILMDIFYDQVKKIALKHLKCSSEIIVVEKSGQRYPPLAILKEKLLTESSHANHNGHKGTVVLGEFFNELLFSELGAPVTWICMR